MPTATARKPPKPPTAPVIDEKEGPSPYLEIGSSGLKWFGGQMNEEFLPDLKGAKGRAVYREMAWNDPMIAALLFVIEMLLRQGPREVKDGGDSPEDKRFGDLVRTSLDDMSLTWEDTLSDILTFLIFGWEWSEETYKVRNGDQPGTYLDAKGVERQLPKSKYNDGLTGWRKWGHRSQLSLDRWQFDDGGGVQAMWQQSFSPNRPRTVPIPIDRSLLFKTKNAGGNPEGQSILRAAYKPYYFAKQIEMYEALSIQRGMIGVPVISIPGKFMVPGATPGDQAVYASWKTIVENVHANNMAGMVIPSDTDAQGKPLYKFELVTAGARTVADTSAILSRLNVSKLVPVLADFILLGHENSGSWALSTDKTEIFGEACSAWQKVIYGVINRFAIPRLGEMNGFRVKQPPQLVPGRVIAPSLPSITALIRDLTGAGADLLPDDGIVNAVLARAGLPQREGSDPAGMKRDRRPKVGSGAWNQKRQRKGGE